jgi:hypothetical protein
MTYCPSCQNDISLGEPSVARWLGPDGNPYCSIHFTNRFGHGEPLVKLEDFEPPKKVKKAAPKKAKA